MRLQEITKEEAEATLGVPARYTKEDLRQCYTTQAREYHPDTAQQNGLTEAQAQEKMTHINKAYAFLKGQFDGANADRVVMRGSWESAAAASGIESGFAGVDWRKGVDPSQEHAHRGAHFRTPEGVSGASGTGFGAYGTHRYGTYEGSESWNQDVQGASDDDFWSFADEDAQEVEEKVPITPRTILLGPVVLRCALCALFAWLVWLHFPLINNNLVNYPISQRAYGPNLIDVAHLLAGLIYPVYFFIFEVLSGQISGLVREVLNGMFSWVRKVYYDLRPKTASYGCALYKILSNQLWSVLMVPPVIWLAGKFLETDPANMVERVIWGVLAVALGIDALAAVVHGGVINMWTMAVAERVEARYLMLRKRLLIRCGKWDPRAQA
ncbi:MAG: DnaJ domain-containing protein [Atopobiaceae bacterium]